jgi:hypothetical protein
MLVRGLNRRPGTMSNAWLTGKTQPITRLLATQVRLVRLELVGDEHPSLSRIGTLILYVPVLLVGYAFMLAALAWRLAIAMGWIAALLTIGIVHLALGTWGVLRARSTATAKSYDVLDPVVAPAARAANASGPELVPPARERRDTSPTLTTLPPPPGSRLSGSRIAAAAASTSGVDGVHR